MTGLLVLLVVGLLVVAAATLLGPRLGVASPLLLVALGVAASFLPVFASARIEPELILEGVLPPLLYASAVSMPAMNFRREFGAISGLSVLLVVGSALLLGLFLSLVVPGLDFAWGVALGAIVSPTDAVATSILKQTSISQRVVALLDGESLLNDATALVLLRTASAAALMSFSFWGALGSFAWSVLGAALVGLAVGWLNLVVRAQIVDPTVNTVISFAVPFVASVPAGLLGSSGLVAAVVAGLVTGIRAPRDLSPQNRLSDAQNWRTVQLVLEGAVFLTMGLQIKPIVAAVERDHSSVAAAVLVGAGALLVTLLVRAAYVVPLLSVLRSWSRHGAQLQTRLQDVQGRLGTDQGRRESFEELNRRRRRRASPRELDRFARRVTQVLADIDYFRHEPLGSREGFAVVWAGMRGAVTVAAAQTLPLDTPQRSVLVLVAFTVATLSLLVQGGTLGPLLRVLAPTVDDAEAAARLEEERSRIIELLRARADAVPQPEPEPDASRQDRFEAARRYRLDVLSTQRSELLDARDNGTFDADVLADALATLDADQIAIELRSGVVG